ncbi:glycoside hydrolase family 3 protein [Paenibacillus sp. YN15]|uniref:glycoside hydrolase family 3 protein n=1 Tax=Paenibacillus sp. YN15 TaxID=1742774 RepID=UPI000DCBA9C8|nr:glycoside hydrolase family 3 protein [Paenibacillus sp. YN15]RAU97112.1 glycoside hydrolase [Paenibacillus sp. YN15]
MELLTHTALREQIGQMVMCGFSGKAPTEDILRLIREYSLGNVIYFRDNIGTPEEVRELSGMLQEAAKQAGTGPLWIAVDQEGGMVARIDRQVALMPGNMALGAAGSPELVYETARISGAELRSLGITLNFAPCVDVNNNKANPVIGVRSYGEDSHMVGIMGAQAVRGYQDSGVGACPKHFPGHGDTTADSHLELPLVPHSVERLRRIELPPFRSAIAAGADVVMTAHVQFPAYDSSGLPATLSPAVLEGLLRQDLGYDGVIATDCLEMKAISGTVGVGRGAVLAVKAGADLVLVSHTPELQLEALEALYQAVLSGDLPQDRVAVSARRIREAKARREESWQRLVRGKGLPAVGSRQHVKVAEQAAERAVTLVKAEPDSLPLDAAAPTLVIWPRVEARTDVEEAIRQEITLGKALKPYLADVQELEVGLTPEVAEVEAVMAAVSAGRLQIVAGTYNAAFNPGQARLVQELLGVPGAKVTAVALRSPYDLLAFPGVHAYLACYENRPLMLQAAAKVLTGRLPAMGRLPVTLSPDYPAGWGCTL